MELEDFEDENPADTDKEVDEIVASRVQDNGLVFKKCNPSSSKFIIQWWGI